MIAALKAEFLKLFTVRSTYIVTLLMLGLTGFVTYQMTHFAVTHPQAEMGVNMRFVVANILPLAALFGAVMVCLSLLHEYRYNTINYALSMMRRSKFLAAKMIVAAAWLTVLYVLAFGVATAATAIGTAGHNVSLFGGVDVKHLVATSMYYVFGFGFLSLLVALIARNITATFAIMFLLPSTIEPLLGLILKSKAAYLPYTLLGYVVGEQSAASESYKMSPGKAAAIFTVYLVVGWAIGWYAFLKRDAN